MKRKKKKKEEEKKKKEEEKKKKEEEKNELNKQAHNNAVLNVKKEIKEKINKIVTELVPNIENPELRKIFNNFLNENIEKSYIWSVNLLISEFYNSEYISCVDYCNFYSEQIELYKNEVKEISDAEKVILNILEGAYMSFLYSLNYVDNNDQILLSQPIECFNILKMIGK